MICVGVAILYLTKNSSAQGQLLVSMNAYSSSPFKSNDSRLTVNTAKHSPSGVLAITAKPPP